MASGGALDTPLPSGMVTFVFTDIAGSTRLFQRLGDGYLEVLQRHNHLLRAAFGHHGGVEIKDEGDALFYAFPDASGALHACVEGQGALAAEEWVHGEPVLVRMGVHTGHATPVGGDYIALPVHQAARIAAATHGGQVVVSAATVEAAGRPSAADLTDLGVHLLRDFDEPARLWQLGGAAFPPLRTRALALPTPRTTFIGRAKELDALVVRLRTAGLTTVVGAGGVGKTRLTLEAVAREAAADIAGVHFIELADETDGEAVAAVLARQLGVVSRPDRSVLDSVIAEIGVRRVLLVVDNCERAIDGAAAVVAAILAACPHASVVATSRTALEVEGEAVVRLDPLPTSGEARAADSVRLLLDRVAAGSGQEHFSEEEVDAAEEICRQLDGLPLALELAAATAARVPLVTLVGELDDRLDLLRARGRTERQQTLRNLLDWSHTLLSTDAQRALRRIAVLPGSFDPAVARAIVSAPGDIAERAVPRLLGELVDQSLVAVDVASGRYALLQTVRVYGSDKLDGAGERDAMEEAVVAWAAAWLSTLDFDGPDIATIGPRLTAEYHTVVRAVELADAWSDERLVSLCARLGRYWHMRGMFGEGLKWCDRALALSTPPTQEKVDLELRRVRLLMDLVPLEQVVAILRDPTTALATCGSPYQRMEASVYEGGSLEQLGRLDEAEACLLPLLADAEAAGDLGIQSRTLNQLGIVAFFRGDFESARDRYAESLSIAATNTIAREMPVMHLNLGEVYLELDDTAQAMFHLLAAAQLAREQDQLPALLAALELLVRAAPDDTGREAFRRELDQVGSTIGPEVRDAIDRQFGYALHPTR